MHEQFSKPPAHHRLMPLWCWNASPNPDEVERQIREMHSRGIGGFFIEECANAKSDCNGKLWMDCIDRARSVAHQLRMFVSIRQSDTSDSRDDGSCSQAFEYSTVIGDVVDLPNSDGGASPALMISADWPGRAAGPNALSEKLGASTAHAAGLQRVAAAVFSPPDWGLTLSGMKANLDQLAAHGINAFLPCGMPYSVSPAHNGVPKASIFYQSVAWQGFRRLADYAARLSFAMSQGRHKAQIALLNPAKGFTYENARDARSPVTRLISDFFSTYCDQLIKTHIDYDIVCEESLVEALAVDQRLIIGSEEYEALILPPTTAVGYAAAQKIVEYVEDGGPLLANALLPLYDADGVRNEDIRRMFYGIFGMDPLDIHAKVTEGVPETCTRLRHNFGNLLFYETTDPRELAAGMREMVSMAVKPEVSIRRRGSECPHVLYQHRELEDRDFYFFVNTSPDPQEVKISIRCDRAPFVMNLETGHSHALANCTLKGSRTVFSKLFHGYESLLVMFADEIALPAIPRRTSDGYEIVLSDYWEFVAEDRNCLPLLNWQARPRPENADEQVLISSFEAETIPRELVLLVERHQSHIPREVRVNGVPVETVRGWTVDVNFEALDVTDHVVLGENQVTLRGRADAQAVPFARVLGVFSLDASGQRICAPKSRMRTGSWTGQGYPYYSGTCHYAQRVEIPALLANQRVVLRAEQTAEVVEFVVNGVSAGIRYWPPCEMDITHLVKPGRNRVEFRITNTSANAMAAQEHPSGLLGAARMVIY